jgi:hypothetical protein
MVSHAPQMGMAIEKRVFFSLMNGHFALSISFHWTAPLAPA